MKEFLKYVFASMVGFIFAQTAMIFGWVFLIALVLGIAASNKGDEKNEVDTDKQKILSLHLSGKVAERVPFQEFLMGDRLSFLGEEAPLGLFEIEQALKEAAEDDTVKGIFIKAGALQAGWATLTSIRNALEKFKQSGKFIYTHADYFSEGTYYIASVSNTVFMYPEGHMELNGFATVLSFFKSALEKLEVEPQIFRAGKYKSAIEPFIRENMSDESREQIQAYTQDLWAVFARTIGKSRKLSAEEIGRLTDGLLVSSAEDAKKYGLVDQLKYSDEVEDFLKGVLNVAKDEKIPFVAVQRYAKSEKKITFGSANQFISMADEDEDDESDKIAIVFAQGEIHMGRSDEQDSIGASTFVEAIREARKDESVKAVVLRINSPGGAALAADKIWREVELTNKVKPVIASFGDVAASGGYYFAAAARKIFAQPTSLTGSIGVFGLSFVAKDLFQNKLGISFDRVVTHASADMGWVHRKITDAESFAIGKEIDRVYDRFLSIVETGRKLPIDELKNMAGGRVWSGWAAQRLKLVDKMGGLPAAIDEAAKEAALGNEYSLQVLPKPKIPFGRIFQLISSKVRANLGVDFGIDVELPGILHPNVMKQPQSQRIYTLLPLEMQTR